jgi:hypothetical protein
MEHSCALGNLVLAKITLYYKGRDARERFALEVLRWLSTLSFIYKLKLFSDLFLQMLHRQGDSELSDSLRAEYFQGIKRG